MEILSFDGIILPIMVLYTILKAVMKVFLYHPRNQLRFKIRKTRRPTYACIKKTKTMIILGRSYDSWRIL